jgi:hypothetical protein
MRKDVIDLIVLMFFAGGSLLVGVSIISAVVALIRG